MASDLSAGELLDRGIRLLDGGHTSDGLRNLRSSYGLDPSRYFGRGRPRA